MLKCDVCGGRLSIDAGGETATCEYCGAKHSMERMREKVQEIKGTVSIEGEVQARQTGTSEDVKQWRILLDRYLRTYNYKFAQIIVNKILEVIPTDKRMLDIYNSLQDLKHFDIRDGVLVKYTGQASRIYVPEGVTKIREEAFHNVTCNELILPDTLEEWQYAEDVNDAVYCIKKIRLGRNIEKYEYGCNTGDEITVLTGNCDLILPYIKSKIIEVPEDYVGNPSLLKFNSRLEDIKGSPKFKEKVLGYDWTIYTDFAIAKSPLIKPIILERQQKKEENTRSQWRRQGVCQYCGGRFHGVLKKKCLNCNRERDY